MCRNERRTGTTDGRN